MSVALMPLCGIPKLATRDGWTGITAHFTIPFLNYIWFASGQIYTFPSGNGQQDRSPTLAGTRKPNVFVKDCCSCLNP